MREPPYDLPNDTMLAQLEAQYGLAVAELTFLPLGHDSSAWVYRVQASDSRAYFLKVRMSIANEASLRVPRYLHDHGIKQVVAPLLTSSGRLWTSADNYKMILYPFVAGTSGMERGMGEQQWIDYGTLLHQIHTTPVTPELAQIMRQERFTPTTPGVKELDRYVSAPPVAEAAAQEFATFWQSQRALILELVARAETLGPRLAQTALPCVLCHADIHTGNVLVDAEGQVWIVDWDETILAPKERDLMFAVGGISAELVGPHEEELFFQGYGATTIDPLALAYYRYAWAVDDIRAFGEEVCFRPDLSAATKQEAVGWFKHLFQPGSIVALAFATETSA